MSRIQRTVWPGMMCRPTGSYQDLTRDASFLMRISMTLAARSGRGTTRLARTSPPVPMKYRRVDIRPPSLMMEDAHAVRDDFHIVARDTQLLERRRHISSVFHVRLMIRSSSIGTVRGREMCV